MSLPGPDGRRLSISLLLWTPQVRPGHHVLFGELKAFGYDAVEVPIHDGEERDYDELRRVLDGEGFARTAVTFATEATNPVSPDPAVRQAASDHLARMVDRAAALGCSAVCGPVHSAYAHFVGRGPVAEERQRCVEVLRGAGERAAAAGVMLGVEFLNRFECYFLTHAAEAADLVREVGHPSVRMVYDTHHGHIEDASVAEAIRASGDVLGHVQLSESHRGLLGRGGVDWSGVFAALDDVGYRGWLVVESFSRADPEFGANLRIWRDFAPDPMDVAREAVGFVRAQQSG